MKSKYLMIQRQAGVSLVELLIGIAVGLFIVAGATKLFADFVISNKRLVVETRVNQDLRAAADIVARDVRRAGYWNNATAGVGGTAVANPHGTGGGAVASTANSLTYSYARAAATELNLVDPSEFAGFRQVLVGGVNVLQMRDGRTVLGVDIWQAVTDPGTVNVTTFSVEPVSPALDNDLSSYCGCLARLTCTLASIAATGTPPILTIPSFHIVLTGQAVNDPAITRTVNETVRVRNASLTGTCPA